MFLTASYSAHSAHGELQLKKSKSKLDKFAKQTISVRKKEKKVRLGQLK